MPPPLRPEPYLMYMSPLPTLESEKIKVWGLVELKKSSRFLYWKKNWGVSHTPNSNSITCFLSPLSFLHQKYALDPN